MKRSILLGIVGIAAAMTTSAYGQGAIQLDNYINSAVANPIMIGGSPISTTGYTVGLYWALGNIVGSVASDPTGVAIPTSLNGSLALGSGTGSAAPVADPVLVFGNPGAYLSQQNYIPPAAPFGSTITVMLVAFNGGDYSSSTMRGHSLAFTMVTTTGTQVAQLSGALETDGGFNVMPAGVPEPTTMALGGLGLASLLLFRRKQA